MLSRYLDPEVLNRIADRSFEPRSLVIGNLAGAHKSPLSGFAVEFAGHREYVPGDDPKHIDWRVYFSQEKLFVKQYELETNFVCHLLLDISASMNYGRQEQQKLLYAAQLVTTLGYCVIRQSDQVSLTTFDDEPRVTVAPSNSMGQIENIARHLQDVEPVERTDLGRCLGDVAGRLGRREIVIIVSDFLGNLASLEQAVQRFRYSEHEVVLFQVLHHDELDFPFGGMTQFNGLETDERLRAQADDVRDSYLTCLHEFQTELRALAERNRCEYVLADTSHRLSHVLADYLDKRRGPAGS